AMDDPPGRDPGGEDIVGIGVVEVELTLDAQIYEIRLDETCPGRGVAGGGADADDCVAGPGVDPEVVDAHEAAVRHGQPGAGAHVYLRIRQPLGPNASHGHQAGRAIVRPDPAPVAGDD